MISAQPLHELCRQGVREKAFPAASFSVGTKDEVAVGCVGRFTYDETAPNVQPDSLFDLASVTKVVGTTSAAMLALDDGLLDLDKPVVDYLPEFAPGKEPTWDEGWPPEPIEPDQAPNQDDKAKVKVRDLLLHCSGLPAYSTFHRTTKTPEEARAAVLGLKLSYATGTKMVYSCMGFISLQQLLQRVTGKALDVFLKERVWDPLGMSDTMYNPPLERRSSCVPTEVDKLRGLIQGQVHDPAAFAMGGVSGNAGLFSTATDLAKFAQCMLRKGDGGGRQIFCSATVESWTTKQTDRSTRGLGWDTKSPEGSSAGSKFSMKSYGHTGFTGTTIWIDPENGIFAVLLTNRVYPTEDNPRLTAFRPRFHDAAFDLLKNG